MIVFENVSPVSSVAETIIRAYMFEVVSRYHGRAATPEELEQALCDEPWNDLEGSTGVLLVAFDEGVPVACGGLRFEGDGVDATAELTKLFTVEKRRGEGIGSRLLLRLEDAARNRDAQLLRLDSRSGLAEACRLYERLGFEQVPPFNEEKYSDRWYSKVLV